MCLAGCINEQSDFDSDSGKSTHFFENAKVILDERKVNISELRIRTAVRSYIDPGNNLSGLTLSYVDGFQPYAKNDAGTFYQLYGKISNVAEETLKNVTISISFTNTSQTDLEIVKSIKYSLLYEGITQNIDIKLFDDVDFYERVNYCILNITIENI
jgi:hypothetical protein